MRWLWWLCWLWTYASSRQKTRRGKNNPPKANALIISMWSLQVLRTCTVCMLANSSWNLMQLSAGPYLWLASLGDTAATSSVESVKRQLWCFSRISVKWKHTPNNHKLVTWTLAVGGWIEWRWMKHVFLKNKILLNWCEGVLWSDWKVFCGQSEVGSYTSMWHLISLHESNTYAPYAKHYPKKACFHLCYV